MVSLQRILRQSGEEKQQFYLYNINFLNDLLGIKLCLVQTGFILFQAYFTCFCPINNIISLITCFWFTAQEIEKGEMVRFTNIFTACLF